MPFPWAGVCAAGLCGYGKRGKWIGGQPGVFHHLQRFSCPTSTRTLQSHHLLTVPAARLMAVPHTRPSSLPSYTPTPLPPSLGIRVYGPILLCCQSECSALRLMLPSFPTLCPLESLPPALSVPLLRHNFPTALFPVTGKHTHISPSSGNFS